eukprot:32993_5
MRTVITWFTEGHSLDVSVSHGATESFAAPSHVSKRHTLWFAVILLPDKRRILPFFGQRYPFFGCSVGLIPYLNICSTINVHSSTAGWVASQLKHGNISHLCFEIVLRNFLTNAILAKAVKLRRIHFASFYGATACGFTSLTRQSQISIQPTRIDAAGCTRTIHLATRRHETRIPLQQVLEGVKEHRQVLAIISKVAIPLERNELV